MEKYVELIKLLEKIFGKGAVSRTIGTRTNVVRFPKGKQPIDPTRSELDVEGSAAKNPDLAQTIENSIADRMGDITKMNDQELLTYTANVRRLVNFKEPPIQNADVVKFGSGEEIKGKGLEQLIEKQGTKNPPTTVAGRLEAQGKKLEKAGEDLKEITEPKSVIEDIIKDYAGFDKYMQSSQKTGYVRATVRQIMREDIQAGKLKLPKELQDQVMQGIGEPIDIYRKVYGEGALEQIDSLADDLGQFRTEEEAAKFVRSKYTFEPKVEPVDESKTYEELEDILKKDPEPEGKADGGIIGYALGGRTGYSGGSKLEGILDVVKKDYDKSITKKIIDKGDEINETAADALRRQIESRLTDEQRKKMNRFLGIRDATIQDIIKDSSSEGSPRAIKRKEEADGGRIGFNKGKRVKSSIDKLLENLNKKTQGKKSMESVDPKTGEVTVPKKPIRKAEEPTGMTTMDPEPEIIDERSITKTKNKTSQRYDQGMIKAANNIFPDYDDPKIAADQIAESYAQMKLGKNYEDLTSQEQNKIYSQAYDYVMDRKRGKAYKQGDPITEENFENTPFAPDLSGLEEARRMTKGMSLEDEMNMVLNQYDKSMFIKNEQGKVDVTNSQNVERMALLLKKDHPELYNRIFNLTDDLNQKEILSDFDVTGRKPNAKGGIAGLL